jgi:hypothetical protein
LVDYFLRPGQPQQQHWQEKSPTHQHQEATTMMIPPHSDW